MPFYRPWEYTEDEDKYGLKKEKPQPEPVTERPKPKRRKKRKRTGFEYWPELLDDLIFKGLNIPKVIERWKKLGHPITRTMIRLYLIRTGLYDDYLNRPWATKKGLHTQFLQRVCFNFRKNVRAYFGTEHPVTEVQDA